MRNILKKSYTYLKNTNSTLLAFKEICKIIVFVKINELSSDVVKKNRK